MNGEIRAVGKISTADPADIARIALINPCHPRDIRVIRGAYPFRKPLFFNTSTSSWTEAADFFSAASSSAVSLI